MIQSMFSGASGLRAHQTQMDVIGDNIANINTVGFKSSRAEFKQTLSDTLRTGASEANGAGGTDPIQVGLGVTVASISANQSQGALQNTGRSLDVAIEGSGFLSLSDGKSQYYTRDGALTVDSKGSLVSAGNNGLTVMGWKADSGTGVVNTTGALAPLTLPVGQLAVARQTGNVAYAGNLDANLAADKTMSTTYHIYDSLGRGHAVTINFAKTANPGEWSWTASSPDGAFNGAGTGTLAFDANGKVATGGKGDATLTLTKADGANAAMKLALDFSSVTALAGNGNAQSAISTTSQDGLPSGSLTSVAIEGNGILTGTFSNGMSQPLGQIALSSFENPNGLLKAGGNLFNQSPNSGAPQVGEPETGGRGKLTSGFLEMSNVDLSSEFTNMIIAQRGFQANSRIITVSDEMLQDLISLKR